MWYSSNDCFRCRPDTRCWSATLTSSSHRGHWVEYWFHETSAFCCPDIRYCFFCTEDDAIFCMRCSTSISLYSYFNGSLYSPDTKSCNCNEKNINANKVWFSIHFDKRQTIIILWKVINAPHVTSAGSFQVVGCGRLTDHAQRRGKVRILRPAHWGVI